MESEGGFAVNLKGTLCSSALCSQGSAGTSGVPLLRSFCKLSVIRTALSFPRSSYYLGFLLGLRRKVVPTVCHYSQWRQAIQNGLFDISVELEVRVL